MKKCILILLTLSLLVCTAAHATEPPVIDLSDFAAELDRMDCSIPKTLNRAIGDTAFGTLPKYELTVDELNDRYILEVNATDFNYAFLMRFDDAGIDEAEFKDTGTPGVYTVDGIAEFDELVIETFGVIYKSVLRRHASDSSLSQEDVFINQEDTYTIELPSKHCRSHSCVQYPTESIIIKKILQDDGDGGGSFLYQAENGMYSITISFDVVTDAVEYCALSIHSANELKGVTYLNRELRYLYFDNYAYAVDDDSSVGDGYWTKDGQPCAAPFEGVHYMYPYPGFLP